jgi:hypothetical protein
MWRWGGNEAETWHVHWTLFPKRLIDGGRSDWSDLICRRKVKGRWQYRVPTIKELQQHFLDQW